MINKYEFLTLLISVAIVIIICWTIFYASNMITKTQPFCEENGYEYDRGFFDRCYKIENETYIIRYVTLIDDKVYWVES